MDVAPFSKRRARLMKQMGRGIAVIPTALAENRDALVTESGCEILTHEAPKTIADIELLMRESRNV